MSTSWIWHSLLVGAGGFVRSVCRFGAGGLVYRILGSTTLPYGTLLVNVAGCFAIGILGGLGDARQVIGTELRLFFFIGVLGGFTTFSAFGYETLALVRAADPSRAVLNVVLHVVAGLLAVWAGYGLGRS